MWRKHLRCWRRVLVVLLVVSGSRIARSGRHRRALGPAARGGPGRHRGHVPICCPRVSESLRSRSRNAATSPARPVTSRRTRRDKPSRRPAGAGPSDGARGFRGSGPIHWNDPRPVCATHPPRYPQPHPNPRLASTQDAAQDTQRPAFLLALRARPSPVPPQRSGGHVWPLPGAVSVGRSSSAASMQTTRWAV